MSNSLPPDDERREKPEDEARQEAPTQAAPRVGLGTMLGLFAVVAILVVLLLPAIQDMRVPAPRSTHDEMEQRQQQIEQAAREASDEDGLATHR
jgi:hypothetical protein